METNMTEQEIIEGNKLIDIFMDNWLVSRGFSETELNYHSDWNLLMPVVEKIESIESFVVSFNREGVFIQNGFEGQEQYKLITMLPWDLRHTSHKEYSKIEYVWLAVVEFIKWLKCQK